MKNPHLTASAKLLGAAALLLASRDARATQEAAHPSDALVQSAGINTHFDFGNTPYVTAYAAVKAKLLGSGLRVIRSAALGDASTLGGQFVPQTQVADLAAAGVRINFLCDLNSKTPATCVALVKAFAALYPGAVASVEGPNEPDGFWKQLYPSGYGGQPYPAGAVQWQKDMYTAFKADPATASIPIYGIALGLAGQPPCSKANPLGDSGELAAYVDFGNFHPYPSGNPWHPDFAYDFVLNYYHQSLFPSALLDPDPGPGLTHFDDVTCQDSKPYGARPMVATESGVETTTSAVPESHLAALVPRVLLENYRLGIAQTLLYELIDSGGQQFGLLHDDVSPRPSYTAVQTLLTRLADPGPSFSPGSLDYGLTVTPVVLQAGNAEQTFDKLSYVHHLLFQKRNGAFELVLWHEIATDETYPSYVSLSPPALPGVIHVNQPFASGTLTTIDETGTPTTTLVDVTGAINLQINERFQILELTPVEPPDAGSDAGAGGSGAGTGGGSGGTSSGATGGAGTGAGGGGSTPAKSSGCGCVMNSAGSAWYGAPALLALLGFGRRRRRHPA